MSKIKPRDMPKSKTEKKVIPSATKKKISVLLIEDDAFLAGIYTTKLSLENFKVFQATDGSSGLKLARQKHPDVILLNILMPKMDGFEVLKKLKKDRELKEIPVIMLTNLGQKEDVDQALKLGAADYLIKAHFVPSDTIKRIKKVLKLN